MYILVESIPGFDGLKKKKLSQYLLLLEVIISTADLPHENKPNPPILCVWRQLSGPSKTSVGMKHSACPIPCYHLRYTPEAGFSSLPIEIRMYV